MNGMNVVDENRALIRMAVGLSASHISRREIFADGQSWVDKTAADNGYEYQMAWMGDDGAYYLRLGSYNQIDPNGPARPALKLVSKQSWKHGLFIADIKNMPNGMCGMASKREFSSN